MLWFILSCCYAFSATDALSAQYMKKYNNMINLSVQEVVDCSFPWSNQGCFGGSMENGN